MMPRASFHEMPLYLRHAFARCLRRLPPPLRMADAALMLIYSCRFHASADIDEAAIRRHYFFLHVIIFFAAFAFAFAIDAIR